MTSTRIHKSTPTPETPAWLEIVRSQVASLRYGTVEIVVHDAHVTQIEKTERVRLDKPQPETKTT